VRWNNRASKTTLNLSGGSWNRLFLMRTQIIFRLVPIAISNRSLVNALQSTSSVQLLPPASMDINMDCEMEQSGVKDDTELERGFMESVVLHTSRSQRTIPNEGSCSRADDVGSVSHSQGIMPNVEPPKNSLTSTRIQTSISERGLPTVGTSRSVDDAIDVV
jgi:hypothetical protein